MRQETKACSISVTAQVLKLGWPEETLHLIRFEKGLCEIGIDTPWSRTDLKAIFDGLLARNGNGNLGIYLQVTRGVTMKRNHAFPKSPTPTIFAF